MSLNISQKSTFIIFIISINIVSVVLLYQPIGKEAFSSNTKHFKYYIYLQAIEPDRDPLKLPEYYSAYYGHDYRYLPNNENEDYTSYTRRIKIFCEEEYVLLEQFKFTHNIAVFGGIVNSFRKCLNEKCPNDLELLKSFFGPDKKNDSSMDDFLGSLNQISEMNICLGALKSQVFELLGDFTSEEDKSKYDLIANTGSGEKAKAAFIIVASHDFFYEITDEHFELMKIDFENFTDQKSYSEDRQDSMEKCNSLFEFDSNDSYEKRIQKFYVLSGFENFTTFSNQIKASIKYMESIEGELVNNKELYYDEYNANPITEEDYQELRNPIPLLHEDSYEFYLMRLKRLECVPFDEKTWKTQMIELSRQKQNYKISDQKSDSNNKSLLKWVKDMIITSKN